MEIILKEKDIITVIMKHFPGVEKVTFDKEDVNATLEISEKGVMSALRKNATPPQAEPAPVEVTQPADVMKPGERVMTQTF